MKLTDVISEYCESQKISRREFARRSGLTNGHLWQIEHVNPKTGKPLIPSVEVYQKIAACVGLTLTQLFEKLDDSPVEVGAETDDEREMWEIREAMRRNPEIRTMFSLTKNATPEDLRKMLVIIKTLRGDD